MKDNFIHVCFIIDESGSMMNSIGDVKGGYLSTLNEQRANTIGDCAISMFTFSSKVVQHFIMKNINDPDIPNELDYTPGGLTAMFDGIGIAIDEVGKTLAAMHEDERPSQNLIVIMTDGEENCSAEYTASRIKEMIKEQEEKYSWKFIYLGTDVTNVKDADTIGISTRAFSTRDSYGTNYKLVNDAVTMYRVSSDNDMAKTNFENTLADGANNMNSQYACKTGMNLT